MTHYSFFAFTLLYFQSLKKWYRKIRLGKGNPALPALLQSELSTAGNRKKQATMNSKGFATVVDLVNSSHRQLRASKSGTSSDLSTIPDRYHQMKSHRGPAQNDQYTAFYLPAGIDNPSRKHKPSLKQVGFSEMVSHHNLVLCLTSWCTQLFTPAKQISLPPDFTSRPDHTHCPDYTSPTSLGQIVGFQVLPQPVPMNRTGFTKTMNRPVYTVLPYFAPLKLVSPKTTSLRYQLRISSFEYPEWITTTIPTHPTNQI
ncbi:hypothetical protein F511_29229 [Dorcoceras hygrometricum]|uniref:Uncharacterized protein n=1 Tax=Dorcoceras hygrometricum TaxID=472368 RepID=A0A2Z7DIT0_9LAMI|nr:hypothetical protein F511_29229 [Dorcoceras hygrometricum]